ncbi:MAG TPA: nucleoside hydrolase, partial [Chloroflexota bacterium]|nr:nucleoside hydrolase [Chloroflexota bacterium]
MDIPFPPDKRARVIVNTDAKNEADDQFALVHALLTPSFEVCGVIPAHFGTRRTTESLRESREEVQLLLRMMREMGWQRDVRVEDGAAHALPDERTPVPSSGASLIVKEALREDPRPLHVAFYGPLTDMASALLMEPRIQERNLRVVWIGGGPWPLGGGEFNLSNDVAAANVVMRSRVEVWQVPSTVYRLMAVSYAELLERVYPHGPLGRYLVEQLVEFNTQHVRGPIEHRSLGDSPAVGVIMYPNCGRWEWRPA